MAEQRKKIRILVVGMTATVGGLETFLMQYCEKIACDRIQFDFLSRFPDCVFADRIAAMGGTLYTITRRSKNPIRFYQEIRAFFKEHGHAYDIIWDNECMINDLTPLMLAKRAGIPNRIYHSHNADNMDTSLKGRLQALLHRRNKRKLPHYATELYACSQEAAKWTSVGNGDEFTIVPNAIDATAYAPCEQTRQAFRSAEGLDGCFVVGNVGRLQYQKNQGFLIEAFAQLHVNVPNARLLLVGEGPDEALLRAQAARLGIAAAVRFLGYRSDIAAVLNGIDLFVLPSRFEGLSIAALEAQAAGLPCLLADTITKDVAVTESVCFLPIEAPEAWADAMQRAQSTKARQAVREVFLLAGYDIGSAAMTLAEALEAMATGRVRQLAGHYILSVPRSIAFPHALTKARQDIEKIAIAQGFAPVEMRGMDSAHGNRWAQVRMAVASLADWLAMPFRLPKGALVVVQYPHFPLKSAPLARMAMPALTHLRRYRFVAVIHDLDSLRGIGGKMAAYSDATLLPRFSLVICHNNSMKACLMSRGIPEGKLVSLGCFDYLTTEPMPERQALHAICIAGNLSPEKCGYLYQMVKTERLPYTLHLYGMAYQGREGSDVHYHGVADAQALPGMLQGGFGLVWDGKTTKSCEGPYGDYMRLNNPHKLSLYLAAGLPVLIWAQAAQAEFVRSNNLGYVIETLDEIPALLDNMEDQTYASLCQNAKRIGEKLRGGVFFACALATVRACEESV